MADIRVEKKRPMWIWLFLVIVLALIIFFYFYQFSEVENQENPEQLQTEEIQDTSISSLQMVLFQSIKNA